MNEADSQRSVKNIEMSAKMALWMGIFIPLAETIRRFKQLLDPSFFLHWFDDYLLGGLLIYAWWQYSKGHNQRRELLIAIWGIFIGALLLSTLGQIQMVINGTGDHGVFSVWLVLAAKLSLLIYGILGQRLAMKSTQAVNRKS